MALDGKGSFQDTSGMNGSLNAHALFTAVSVSCDRTTSASDIRDALPRAVAAASSVVQQFCCCPRTSSRRS